jgi:hypothetical protein
MVKLPYIHLYKSDWKNDPALSLCSPATRGIWADLLFAMDDLDRTGQITGTAEELARTCRCSELQMRDAIAELNRTKAADVMERNGNFTVINRRMQREHKERLANRDRVYKHRSNGTVMDKKQKSNALSSQSSLQSQLLSGNVSTTELNGEAKSNGDHVSRRASADDERKKSRFSYAQRLAFAQANDKIKKPEAFAQSLQAGERDAEIEAFFAKPTPGTHEDLEPVYRVKIAYLKSGNAGSDYDDQALLDDLKYHFEKLGKWDELLARKILHPQGD